MADTHPNKGKGVAKWTKDHDVRSPSLRSLTSQALLVQGMIELLLQKPNRAALYALPGIVGEVDNNGGDRVNKKIKEILRNLAKTNGVDASVVNAATEKRAGPGEGSKPRKRARKIKEENEVKEEDEIEDEDE